MRITFEIPANIEEELRASVADIDADAKEIFLVNLGYRPDCCENML